MGQRTHNGSPQRSDRRWVAHRSVYPAVLAVATAVISACSVSPVWDEDGAPSGSPDVTHVPDAVPRQEPLAEHGNPPFYSVDGRRYHVRRSAAGYSARGIASWYGTKFHGKRTSSGERYDMYAMTAAHKTLPLPSYVRVTNLRNGRSVVVRVNDRGPFVKNRLIDLSYAAATKLDVVAEGTAPVQVEAVTPGGRPHAVPVSADDGGADPAAYRDRLYIQVGAFSSPGNAQRLRDQLSSLSVPGVKIRKVTSSGARPIYRVHVGPLSDLGEADRMTEHLAERGITESRIIVR